MINIGEYNELLVLRKEDPGMFLVHPSEAELGEEAKVVLLPNAYIPAGLTIGELIEVFIYLDSEDRIIATTLRPSVTVNQFALLEVKEVNAVGAFMEWGLAKDLLIPFRQQAEKMVEGNSYLVWVYLDETTKRLIGSSKINQFLSNDQLEVEEGQEVDLMVVNITNLGYNLIVEGKHKGLVFHDAVFGVLNPGDQLKGYVKQIRPDNKLDIVLQQIGVSSFEPNGQKIMDHLQASGGISSLGDKSDPEEIYAALGMSKKSFKKALGILYKKRAVEITEKGIKLI